MQTVIVDTDVAIDFLRGAAYARELMARLWRADLAYLSILSAYELYAGMKDSESDHTENFVSACLIEPVTMDIARRAGAEFRQSRKKGVTLTSIDCLIYATALQKKHKVATKNIGHYPDKSILLATAN